MIPLIIWAVKELVETEAEDTIAQTKIAQDLRAKILSATGLDKAELLTEDEVDKLYSSGVREIESAVLAKIKANLAG